MCWFILPPLASVDRTPRTQTFLHRRCYPGSRPHCENARTAPCVSRLHVHHQVDAGPAPPPEHALWLKQSSPHQDTLALTPDRLLPESVPSAHTSLSFLPCPHPRKLAEMVF